MWQAVLVFIGHKDFAPTALPHRENTG